MHNSGIAWILLNHVTQELDPEDDVPRFVSSYGGEAATKSREKPVHTVEFQDTALPGKRHCALDDHVIEGYAFDKARQVFRFALNASCNL